MAWHLSLIHLRYTWHPFSNIKQYSKTICIYRYSRPLAKLTSLLKSPKALGVGVSLPPSSPKLPLEVVGENMADELGVIPLEGVGSISIDVRNEESWRSELEDVTDRKMSRSFC